MPHKSLDHWWGVPPPATLTATVIVLHWLLAPILSHLRGLRDRAVLLVGFAGALKRSEMAAIRLEQLERTERTSASRCHRPRASKPTR